MKCFYFYDLPRTGGTTLKRWVKNRRNLRRLHYGSPKPWHHVPFTPLPILDQQLRPRGYNQKIHTITLLRDPCLHTISLYGKIRHHKHAYASKFQSISFQEWIHGDFPDDVLNTPDPWGFSMVRFYDPETHNLGKAIENIESIDFVGFTERLNSDINLFLLNMGLPEAFTDMKLNVSRKGFKASEDDLKVIREVRSQDYELVNYFRKKRGLEPYV